MKLYLTTYDRNFLPSSSKTPVTLAESVRDFIPKWLSARIPRIELRTAKGTPQVVFTWSKGHKLVSGPKARSMIRLIGEGEGFELGPKEPPPVGTVRGTRLPHAHGGFVRLPPAWGYVVANDRRDPDVVLVYVVKDHVQARDVESLWERLNDRLRVRTASTVRPTKGRRYLVYTGDSGVLLSASPDA